ESLLYNGLATVYYNQNRWDESLRFYKVALEKEKDKDKDKQDVRFIEHIKININRVELIL
ncbi:MAG: tetratricopeptide repeat protein, partial [Romboutsia sp.]|uniref:tetratricopeptide repeat protein n=1 Tax=Romboutsia sp. TaxID=1965302 RepID=UPI003F3F1C21